MARSSAYETVLDAGLFTPDQLQPTAVGRLAFQAGTRWMRDHVCSHRMLVSEHRVGFVLWSYQLEYVQPLRFLDADEALVEVTARVRGPRASQLEVTMTLEGPAGVAVRTRAASVPLGLSGDAALSGSPVPLPAALVAAFRDDEIERAPHRSRVPALRAGFERDGQRLAVDVSEFRVHRHHCEVADQWYWAETLGFAAGAREELVRRHGRAVPELRRAQAGPVRRIDVTWLRAGQLWDLMRVRTSAHRTTEGLAFVHELGLAEDEGGPGGPYAVVVERI
ncbi:acyl-CoA thioesterase [Streptomyces sp. C11-1]|uniref:Acyl-CoA thioesterase n=1 Tax=Streptomyces durocortorensis TaxID=2811104 RepID=A0ABY9VN71_9ACTN|nr:acyl-CoA thioesterase [Streptomyces durocortorensis]WNF25377.1 acyl-CoA thioesterase [Streptomyces durocortorensis]